MAGSISLSATNPTSQTIGLNCAIATSCTLTSNTVRNLTTNVGTGTGPFASILGISVGQSVSRINIAQNTIFGLTQYECNGCRHGHRHRGHGRSWARDEFRRRNLIYGLTMATANSAAEINGIFVRSGLTTYRNNMIAIGAGITTAVTTSTVSTSPLPVERITFTITAFISAAAQPRGRGNSFAFNSLRVTVSRNYLNNIFYNGRSNAGATGSNYAVQVGGMLANPAGLDD